MRTHCLKLCFLIAAALCYGNGAVAQSKIGLIDLRKVFDEYYKTKVADAALKDRAAELEKEKAALMEQYQGSLDNYKKALEEANNQAISAEERERRKKAAEGKLLELKELEGNISQFDRQARSTLDERTRRMRENILEEIRVAITALAKRQGFTLVIDTAAETVNKTPVLIYSSGENDITDDILSQINTNLPPGGVKTPTKTSPGGVKTPEKNGPAGRKAP